MPLAWLMAVSLCACEARPAKRPEPTQASVPTPTAKPEKTFVAAYQQALERLLEEHIDPDPMIGTYDDNAWELIGEIEFAVCDVDVDGEKELILRYADTYMAGQHTSVYRYDTISETLVMECSGTASCLFYDNGTAQDPISHNQGWSGKFWPFTALRYDTKKKIYQKIAFVEALDKEFMEAADIPGFPEEIDTDGAGFVYYIHKTEDGEIDWQRDVSPVSQSEYDAWYDSIFGGAKEIEVNYRSLTAENIRQVCGALE